MHIAFLLLLLAFCRLEFCSTQTTYLRRPSNQGPLQSRNEIPIVIKDDGVKELVKGDVALILYIFVTNTGHESVHLSVNATKCCQKFSRDDEDCESMNPLGGDMGELYPQDPRNLTLVFPNLYLHDRVGSCDVSISSADGKVVTRNVKFNTTLPRNRARIPRLLEQYYEPDDMMNCERKDQDPLNMCRPVNCLIKYNGYRNFYNHTSQQCEKMPRCVSVQEKDLPDVAYVPVINSCQRLKQDLTAEDKAMLTEGRLGNHSLKHSHGYPMNIRCHHGQLDPDGYRCKCNRGWESSHFDPASFNFDVQVYHMCTLWTGELSAEEAANITHVLGVQHSKAGYVIFSLIGSAFLMVAIVLCIICLSQRRRRLRKPSDRAESLRLVSKRDRVLKSSIDFDDDDEIDFDDDDDDEITN